MIVKDLFNFASFLVHDREMQPTVFDVFQGLAPKVFYRSGFRGTTVRQETSRCAVERSAIADQCCLMGTCLRGSFLGSFFEPCNAHPRPAPLEVKILFNPALDLFLCL
ncbi:MAG: hypothetical protein ABSB50_20605 [Terracidiphilus sp.]